MTASKLRDPGLPPLPDGSAVGGPLPMRGVVTDEGSQLARRVRERAWELQEHPDRRVRRLGYRLGDAALLLEVGSERETPGQLLAAARAIDAEARRLEVRE